MFTIYKIGRRTVGLFAVSSCEPGKRLGARAVRVALAASTSSRWSYDLLVRAY